MPLEDNAYYGKAMVNEFSVSEGLLKNLSILDGYTGYDESELNEAGLVLTEDEDYTQRYFLQDAVWRGPENMGYYYPLTSSPENYDDVIRYHYRGYLAENHRGITVIGIQSQNALEPHEDFAQHSFMDGRLDQEEVVKQFRSANRTALITCIVIALGCLVTGGILIGRRK